MQNFAASTISGHLSAISFISFLKAFPYPCQDFMTQRVVGCKKSAPSTDSRRYILLKIYIGW